jgi:CheY-like chemotaxis protein
LKRILWVDDEPFAFRRMVRDLTGLGYVVEPASTAEVGARKLETTAFDLVILDLCSPAPGDGETLLKALRAGHLTSGGKRQATRADTPVVVASGYSDPSELLHTYSREGAPVVHLEKPFTSDELLEVVLTLLPT